MTDATPEAEDIVKCPACGSLLFRLRTVEEHDSEGVSVYAFCEGCGNATGKMKDRTVDNRIAGERQ